MWFWLLPTEPVLKLNYLERAYDVEKIEKFRKGELAEEVFMESEYDGELSTCNNDSETLDMSDSRKITQSDIQTTP